MISCRIFSLLFDTENGQFDQQDLNEFLDTHNVAHIQAQFFTYLDKPYYGIVVFYETMVASTAPRPFKKDGDGEEPYKKILVEADWPLFEKLREWRKAEADKIQKPAYIIADNVKLARIAHHRPKTLAQLEEIQFGQAHIAKYGQAVIEIVTAFEAASNAQ